MLNIVVPMADDGSVFLSEDGAWVQVQKGDRGHTRIQLFLDSLRPRQEHRFIFAVSLEQLGQLNVAKTLQSLAPGCVIIPVAHGTRGEACAVLLARKLIDRDEPLLIARSDGWLVGDVDSYLAEMDRRQADGTIATWRGGKANRSYADVDERGRLRGIAQRPAASSEAILGLYHFRHGTDFVRAAGEMIKRNLHVNNEFFIAPACRQMLDWGATVVTYQVGGGQSGDGHSSPARRPTRLAAQTSAA